MENPQAKMMASWQINAAAWTESVRDRRIESRRLVTDQAIVNKIRQVQPKRLLDLGCGEGWLCRALQAEGIATVGVDGSSALIDRARALGGEFYVGSYGGLPNFGQKFDAIVCNFSLLEEALTGVLGQLQGLVTPQGSLLIQTIHPSTIGSETSPGWQLETFETLGTEFSQAMPWYFRRTEDWLQLLHQTGWHLETIAEPSHPQTQQPLSLLLQAQLGSNRATRLLD